ncbi:MAG: DUF6049 family protein, partial [Bowdeniella nasicola]|nr:DUF6049 family protein [Bowdeniella nasicola]
RESITANTPLYDRVAPTVTEVKAIAAATDNPNAVLTELNLLVSRLLSTALSGQGELRTELIEQIHTLGDSIGAAIQIEAPSSVFLIADTTEIPVTIQNALPADARVHVTFKASDPRLQSPEETTAVLEGNTRTTVRLPVNAVGSGNVWMNVRLLDDSGTLLTESEPFEVQVRADWESVGTGIFAGILVAMIILGLIRTIRRHRDGKARVRNRVSYEIPPAHLRVKENKR